jgi:hypothetical protein
MWKPVRGYEGLYEVSDSGEVKRLAGFWCRHDRLLDQHVSNTGYARVSLSTRTRRNPLKRSVHRLVYEAFVGQIPDGITVNHKNGNKRDNRVCNLELATMSEQMRHAVASGLQPRRCGEGRGPNVAKLTTAQVLDIRRRYKKHVVTARMLAADFGVSEATILAIANRQRWAHL